MNKTLFFIGIVMLAGYPLLELTRLIFWYWDMYGLIKPFYLEILLMWLSAAIGVLILYTGVKD